MEGISAGLTPMKPTPKKKPAPPRPAAMLSLDVDMEHAWSKALDAGASSVDVCKSFRKYAGGRASAEKAQAEAA